MVGRSDAIVGKIAVPRLYSSATQPKGPVSYISLALTAATGAGLMWWYSLEKEKRLGNRAADPVVTGSAAIGGPFNLVDQNGKEFTHEDLKGRFALLYFGFTHCPDICPEELEKIVEALTTVEQETGTWVQPVFISLDPERDSVAQVSEYVKEFHPKMLGLTGTLEQTTAAARAYRVYYSKTNDSKDDYLVDHSIITYLVNPDGEFVTYFGKNVGAEALAKSIKGHVSSWKE